MDNTGISQENQAVFKTISDLVMGSEFNTASVEFMQKHMNVFEDTDENKLEYSTIHEEYIQILEGTIDSKLFQTYSEPQIKAFYDDFKDNSAQYAKINEDVVDTLYGFVDFNKFKKQMLEVKKQETTTSGDANATYGHFTVDEATFWEFYNNQGAASEGWQQKLDYKGNVEVLLFQKTIKHGKTESYINKTKIKFKGIRK